MWDTVNKLDEKMDSVEGGLSFDSFYMSEEMQLGAEINPVSLDKISIVIPAYNEGEHISEHLEHFLDVFSSFAWDFELIVVDDGSTDDTYSQACGVQDDRIMVLTYPENMGKGHALQEGVKHATGEYVTFMDADLDLDPRQLDVFMNNLVANGHDIVIGSKRHPLSKVEYPLKRRFLSASYQLFTRFLFGLNLKDTQAGLKLFKKEALMDILPRAVIKRYAFDLELLVIANKEGYKIEEAPIVLDYRFNGSGVGWRAIRDIFIDTCAIFYRAKLLRYYDKDKGGT